MTRFKQSLSVLRSIPSRAFIYKHSTVSAATSTSSHVPTPSSTDQDDILRQKMIMKRFWKNANVKETSNGYSIELDDKPLKTPDGHRLNIPLKKKSLAYLVAAEWEGQERKVRPHSFPLTSLVMRASDSFGLVALLGTNSQNEMLSNSSSMSQSQTILSEEDLERYEKTREVVIEQTLKYLHTDATCYRQPYPESFVALQSKHWDPLISWIKSKYDVDVKTTDGILGIRQPPATVDKMRRRLERMSALELAAMEKTVLMTKSFIIGLALMDRHISVPAAADAARVEVIQQISKWGEVEDSHDTSREDLLRHLGAAVCIVIQ